MKVLIEYGLDVNSRNINNQTPLHSAVRVNNGNKVKILI